MFPILVYCCKTRLSTQSINIVFRRDDPAVKYSLITMTLLNKFTTHVSDSVPSQPDATLKKADTKPKIRLFTTQPS